MTTQIHITSLLPDYVLGLLSPHETQQVEKHVHHCIACREALTKERQIGFAVRQTLAAVSRPKPGQLARHMPPPPRLARPRPLAIFRGGQRLAAAALLVLLITVGTLSLYPNRRGTNNIQPQAVTSIAVTATREPTSTLVPTTHADEPASGPSPTYEVFLMPKSTPPPAGTPIASLPLDNQP